MYAATWKSFLDQVGNDVDSKPKNGLIEQKSRFCSFKIGTPGLIYQTKQGGKYRVDLLMHYHSKNKTLIDKFEQIFYQKLKDNNIKLTEIESELEKEINNGSAKN